MSPDLATDANATGREGGFEAFLDAADSDESYYLECANGHGWLPPRRVCPACGSRELSQTSLPESGTLLTHTVVTVPTPRFADDAPYATAIAAFEAVRVTGVVRGIDFEAIETGLEVELGIEETATTGERVVAFRPR